MQIKKAFTLTELLIVIIIIGAVYTVFVADFVKQPPPKVSKFEDLKSIILSRSENRPAKMVCSGDKCETCRIFESKGGEPLSEPFTFFAELPVTYTMDVNGYIDEKQFDEPTCFEFEVFANLSGSHQLVAYQNSYYLFEPLLHETRIFDDYDEAIKAYNPESLIPQSLDDYYYKR